MPTKNNQRAAARNREHYIASLADKLANLHPLSENEVVGIELNGASATANTLAFDEPVRDADGEAWPLCAIAEHELVYCPRHEDTEPVAVKVGSDWLGTDGVYCPVCDRAFWAVARSYRDDDETPACQPVGKGPDHVPVLASTEAESNQQPKSRAILTPNDWSELMRFMQESDELYRRCYNH